MPAPDIVRLTRFVECAGCASKMDSSILARVLREVPALADPKVLVDYSTADDAGVYRISADLAIVLTVDFFTPIVDDPRTFGRIAAANALSDIYAMGAKPITALAVATFPETGLDESVLTEIFAGGTEKAAEAGIAVIGGHTVKDPEPKYGLSVVGTVHPDRIVRNSTARAGDVLVLTKPIGTGILTTSRRRDVIDDDALADAVASMCTLNRAAASAMATVGADAATDVTGFGLLGHLREMADGSGLGADIEASAVPVFDSVVDLAARGYAPGGTQTNLRNAIAAGAEFDDRIAEPLRLILADAQTSGGLLIAVPQERLKPLFDALSREGVNRAAEIGRMASRTGLRVH
jgi:selenide,water dikinase